jgi:hypothetical protein
MMTCSNCQTNLDEAPVGTPCPTCGSLRRDATVSPPIIAATAHVFDNTTVEVEPGELIIEGQAVDLTVTMGVEALLTQRKVREVAEDGRAGAALQPPE